MIFVDYQKSVKRRILRDMSGSEIDAYCKRWINSATKSIAMEASWKDLRMEDTITTVADTEEYVLPYDFGNVACFWHRELGYNFRLNKVPERRFVGSGEIGTTTGIPRWYRMFNSGRMLAQPTAASVLAVVSSAASGDVTQKIRIEGIVSSYPDAETVELNNTTSVSTTKSFTRVDRISKSASTSGRITVTSNSAAVTVGVLPAGLGDNTLRREWVKLYYIPDDEFTIYTYYYRKVLKMVDDNDTTPFSEDFDELIILKACQIGMGFEEGILESAKLIWMDYKDELKRLKKKNMKDDDWKLLFDSIGEEGKGRTALNFGAYYPPVYR